VYLLQMHMYCQVLLQYELGLTDVTLLALRQGNKASSEPASQMPL